MPYGVCCSILGKCKKQSFSTYLNSKFLGHAAALDIIHEFNEGIKELNKFQLLQISMDGPSVNWAFLK